MLKQEIARLENSKGVKSSLSGGAGRKLPPGQQDSEELIKLRGENGRLRNQVKVSEIEINQKNEKIEKLLLQGMDAQGGEDPRIA